MPSNGKNATNFFPYLINAERNKTGGGTESNLKLNTIEEATLNLICSTSIIRHTKIKESEVQIGLDSQIKFYINLGNC